MKKSILEYSRGRFLHVRSIGTCMWRLGLSAEIGAPWRCELAGQLLAITSTLELRDHDQAKLGDLLRSSAT